VCHPLQDDPTSDTANYNATLTLRQPAFLSPRHWASFAVFAERRSEFKAYTRQAVGANVAVTFNARRDVPVTVGYSYSVGRTPAARIPCGGTPAMSWGLACTSRTALGCKGPTRPIETSAHHRPAVTR